MGGQRSQEKAREFWQIRRLLQGTYTSAALSEGGCFDFLKK